MFDTSNLSESTVSQLMKSRELKSFYTFWWTVLSLGSLTKTSNSVIKPPITSHRSLTISFSTSHEPFYYVKLNLFLAYDLLRTVKFYQSTSKTLLPIYVIRAPFLPLQLHNFLNTSVQALRNAGKHKGFYWNLSDSTLAWKTSTHRVPCSGLQTSSGGRHHGQVVKFISVPTVVQFGSLNLIGKETQYFRTC